MILLKRAAGLGQDMKGLIPLKAPKPSDGDGSSNETKALIISQLLVAAKSGHGDWPSNGTKALITSQLLVAAKSGHGDWPSNRTKVSITSQLSLSRSDTGPDGRLRQP